jgi:hypothetical protein
VIRTIAKVVLYGAALLILALIGYTAWFAYIWGFNPMIVFPLALFGSGMAALAIVIGRAIGTKRTGL